jgi:hypothetical protein
MNRVYKLLFSDVTIHLDGTAANPDNKFKLRISTCATPLADYLATQKLVGASHVTLQGVNGNSTIMTYETKGPVCDSNLIFLSDHVCRQQVQRSTQFLRVCRKIHDDAALIPFATNAFVFSCGFYPEFRAAFAQQFSEKQRRAIRTAVVPAIFLDRLTEVPGLIPGVKHLWLESPASWREDGDDDEATRVMFP